MDSDSGALPKPWLTVEDLEAGAATAEAPVDDEGTLPQSTEPASADKALSGRLRRVHAEYPSHPCHCAVAEHEDAMPSLDDRVIAPFTEPAERALVTWLDSTQQGSVHEAEVPPPLVVRLLSFLPRSTRDAAVLSDDIAAKQTSAKLDAVLDLLDNKNDDALIHCGLQRIAEMLTDSDAFEAVLKESVLQSSFHDVVVRGLPLQGTVANPYLLVGYMSTICGDPRRNTKNRSLAAKNLCRFARSQFPQATQVVVDAGAVPHICSCLSCPDPMARGEACLALSSLVDTNDTTVREQVRHHDEIITAVPDLLRGLCRVTENPVYPRKNWAWTLAYLLKAKPTAPYALCKEVLPCLLTQTWIEWRTGQVSDVTTALWWALSYSAARFDIHGSLISWNEDNDGALLAMIKSSLPEAALALPVLRLVGNIIEGEDEHTDVFVAGGIIDILAQLVQDRHASNVVDDQKLLKEALWMLSNIAVGSASQLVALVRSPVLAATEQLLRRLDKSTTPWDMQLRTEASWLIRGLTEAMAEDYGSHFLNSASYEGTEWTLPTVEEFQKECLSPSFLGCLHVLVTCFATNAKIDANLETAVPMLLKVFGKEAMFRDVEGLEEYVDNLAADEDEV